MAFHNNIIQATITSLTNLALPIHKPNLIVLLTFPNVLESALAFHNFTMIQAECWQADVVPCVLAHSSVNERGGNVRFVPLTYCIILLQASGRSADHACNLY